MKKKKCRYEDWIDDYVLGRLPTDRKENFEEHLFNCPRCFEEARQREELLWAVKTEGHHIFAEEIRREKASRPSFLRKLGALLTPKEWAAALTSAALIILIVIALTPRFKPESPQFFLSDETVRGETVTLISPLGQISTPPARFVWKKMNKDVEYTLYLYDSRGNLIFSQSTENSHWDLSETTRGLLTSGTEYTWQVKAFSMIGTLTAVSQKRTFIIR